MRNPGRKRFLRSWRGVVLISRASGGRSLTITTRKEDLKELATAFNDERKDRIEALRAAASQHYQLTYQIRFKDEALPLLVLLRDFVQAFSIAYLERKKQENAFEFWRHQPFCHPDP